MSSIGSLGVGATVEVSEMESLAKGSTIVGDGTGAPSILAGGANGQVYTFDSAEATGVKWSAATPAAHALGGTEHSADTLANLNSKISDATLSDYSGFTAGSIPFANGSGLVQDNANLFWDNTAKRMGIGTNTPNAPLELVADTPGVVGGFASGAFHVRSPSTLINANAVITGHNSFGGNKQLWYLGSSSSSNDNVIFINRQNGTLSFGTNGSTQFTIAAAGAITATGDFTAGKLIADNVSLDGNLLSTSTGDLDVTTQTGGVFKFLNNAFRSGQDGSNYIEIGHGGGNGFVNSVGAGGMDFRFGGVTKATFTTAGHLHLQTDTDQKHTLKIITNNNLNDTGIAWENSGGSFTHTIFRTDIGSNRADLIFAAGQNSDIDLLTNSFKIHGSAANAGKLEILSALQISGGISGAFAQDQGNFSVAGDARVRRQILRNITTDAIQTELFLNGSSTRMTIPVNTTWAFSMHVVARRTDVEGETAHFKIEGMLSNNAGTTALDGAVTVTELVDEFPAAGVDVIAEADDTNDALVVKVTGDASATIQWVVFVLTVETTG